MQPLLPLLAALAFVAGCSQPKAADTNETGDSPMSDRPDRPFFVGLTLGKDTFARNGASVLSVTIPLSVEVEGDWLSYLGIDPADVGCRVRLKQTDGTNVSTVTPVELSFDNEDAPRWLYGSLVVPENTTAGIYRVSAEMAADVDADNLEGGELDPDDVSPVMAFLTVT